jgi:molybdenum cofactor cytidylyltransferase
MQSVGLLLLAAGASTRLGQAKQLLPYEGQTLLRRAAETAVASGCQPLVLVTGALYEELLTEVAGLPFEVVRNDAWAEGMGSSIRAGMAALAELIAPENPLSAVLVMLCDQPLLTADHLQKLLARQRETGRAAVASAYAGTLGVPVVFGPALFDRLGQLHGAKGAGPLLASLRPDEVGQVDFPNGVVDVDTPAQYQQLLNKHSSS